MGLNEQIMILEGDKKPKESSDLQPDMRSCHEFGLAFDWLTDVAVDLHLQVFSNIMQYLDEQLYLYDIICI